MKKIFAYFVLLFVFCPSVFAADYTNSNFILRNPGITISGGRSTTATFEFYSATGQIAPGESTNSNFKYQAGILYFDVEEEEEEEATPPPSSGGSGSNQIVTFSGKAYPNSTVILLKDSQIASTVQADSNSNFTTFAYASPGDYIFALYSKDYLGKASRLVVLPVEVDLKQNAKISNILIPPTISRDKKVVKKGDTIDIFGQSFNNASVKISIETPTASFSVTTNSDASGKYKYALGTSSLDFGQYKAESQVSFWQSIAVSSYVNFSVGEENVLEEVLGCQQVADMNGDCAVNLIDFSILIYWFGKPNVPAKIDLSSDGKADLVDFSIMAYYWTG